MQFQHGILVFGVNDVLPLRGFPEGKARVRMRNTSFVQVFIRTPGGVTRRFFVTAHEGAWWPAHETASNTEIR